MPNPEQVSRHRERVSLGRGGFLGDFEGDIPSLFFDPVKGAGSSADSKDAAAALPPPSGSPSFSLSSGPSSSSSSVGAAVKAAAHAATALSQAQEPMPAAAAPAAADDLSDRFNAAPPFPAVSPGGEGAARRKASRGSPDTAMDTAMDTAVDLSSPPPAATHRHRSKPLPSLKGAKKLPPRLPPKPPFAPASLAWALTSAQSPSSPSSPPWGLGAVGAGLADLAAAAVSLLHDSKCLRGGVGVSPRAVLLTAFMFLFTLRDVSFALFLPEQKGFAGRGGRRGGVGRAPAQAPSRCAPATVPAHGSRRRCQRREPRSPQGQAPPGAMIGPALHTKISPLRAGASSPLYGSMALSEWYGSDCGARRPSLRCRARR